jgi:hypothetical protein
LRRAGFFRGFLLLGVVLEGWTLAAVTAVSVGAAMSIYLRDSVSLPHELVGPVHKNEPLRLYAMHCLSPNSRPHWPLGGRASSTGFQYGPRDRVCMQKGSRMCAMKVTFVLVDIQGTVECKVT